MPKSNQPGPIVSRLMGFPGAAIEYVTQTPQRVRQFFDPVFAPDNSVRPEASFSSVWRQSVTISWFHGQPDEDGNSTPSDFKSNLTSSWQNWKEIMPSLIGPWKQPAMLISMILHAINPLVWVFGTNSTLKYESWFIGPLGAIAPLINLLGRVAAMIAWTGFKLGAFILREALRVPYTFLKAMLFVTILGLIDVSKSGHDLLKVLGGSGEQVSKENITKAVLITAVAVTGGILCATFLSYYPGVLVFNTLPLLHFQQAMTLGSFLVFVLGAGLTVGVAKASWHGAVIAYPVIMLYLLGDVAQGIPTLGVRLWQWCELVRDACVACPGQLWRAATVAGTWIATQLDNLTIGKVTRYGATVGSVGFSIWSLFSSMPTSFLMPMLSGAGVMAPLLAKLVGGALFGLAGAVACFSLAYAFVWTKNRVQAYRAGRQFVWADYHLLPTELPQPNPIGVPAPAAVNENQLGEQQEEQHGEEGQPAAQIQ